MVFVSLFVAWPGLHHCAAWSDVELHSRSFEYSITRSAWEDHQAEIEAFQRRNACWIVILQHILDFLIHLWQTEIKPRVLWSVRKRVTLKHVVVAARLDSDCPDDALWRRKWECMSNTIIFWIDINSDIWNLGLCTIKMEAARYGIHLHDGFHKAFSQVVVTTNGEPE